MQPVRIPDSTHCLPAPDNWDEEQAGRCAALHVRAEIIDGVHFLRSAWEPSSTEAGWILAGSRLVLGVAGHAHPVVHLGVLPPPEDFAPVVTIRQFSTIAGRAVCRVEMFCKGGVAYVEVSLGEGTLAEAGAMGLAEVEQSARAAGWID